ncbi:hypothetical protein KFU94_06400 [Chloroflexi bacterium TSY]|nr:hypothetical protein [Chloroflexi bacterium TSY]
MAFDESARVVLDEADLDKSFFDDAVADFERVTFAVDFFGVALVVADLVVALESDVCRVGVVAAPPRFFVEGLSTFAAFVDDFAGVVDCFVADFDAVDLDDVAFVALLRALDAPVD